MTADDLLLPYAKSRAERDQTKAIAEVAEKEFRIAEAQLLDAMLDEEKKPEWRGSKFSPSKRFEIACNAENIEQTKEWLQLVAGDLEPFTTRMLSKTAVKEYVRAEVEKDDTFEPPKFLNLNQRPTLGVTNWPALKASILEGE